MAKKTSGPTYTRRTARRRARQSRHTSAARLIASIAIACAIWAIWHYIVDAPAPAAAEAQRTDTPAYTLSGSLLDVATPADMPRHMIDYPGFTVCFNPQLHIPNYVAWELTATETTGPVERLSTFFVDPDVPGCATPADYKKSGYSRGHMAPAADMKWSADAMRASNNLTNICPQTTAMNSGAWSTLEDNCRTWARRDSALVIITGPVLTDRMPLHIGKNHVAVPERFFKVVLAPYAIPPRGIGFIMPNAKVAGGVQATAMTIDEVEAITGLDFFAALPDEIERDVESQNSYPQWQTLK